MSITRVNFNSIGAGGDTPTAALVRLDANCADLDGRVTSNVSSISTLTTSVGTITSTIANASGLYSARPSATAVMNGAIYYATDVMEAYRSNGTAWSVLPTSGGELGYAEKTSSTSTTSTTPVDISGLTVTCRVGEKPVIVTYGGTGRHQTVGSSWVMQMVYGASSIVGSQVQGVGAFTYLQRSTRISGLTPGSTYTFKLQLSAATTGTVDIFGASTNAPFIRVANA